MFLWYIFATSNVNGPAAPRTRRRRDGDRSFFTRKKPMLATRHGLRTVSTGRLSPPRSVPHERPGNSGPAVQPRIYAGATAGVRSNISHITTLSRILEFSQDHPGADSGQSAFPGVRARPPGASADPNAVGPRGRAHGLPAAGVLIWLPSSATAAGEDASLRITAYKRAAMSRG
jgi:hypothetical protein